ncbi:hypothetical protein ACC743_39730, partial [Rhizobium ruizarguesonis]
YTLLGADLFLISARLLNIFTLRNFWNADVPVCIAWHPGVGVGNQCDDRRPVRRLRPLHRRLQIGKAIAATGKRAHGFG